MQNGLGPQRLHGIDLDSGRGSRHDDQRPNPQLFGGQGDALRMVTRRCSNHTRLSSGFTETGDFVIGAPQLEREYRLQILALDVNRVTQPATEPCRIIQRAFDRHVIDAGAQNALNIFGQEHGFIRGSESTAAGSIRTWRERQAHVIIDQFVP